MYHDYNYEAIEYMLIKIKEGFYTVRDADGRLINKYGRIIGSVDKNGYLRYGSKVNNKRHPCAGHRVAFAYYYGIEELKKHETVNHIDGNKLNNSKENLEGCSFSENAKHEWETGLNKGSIDEKTVKEVRKLYSLGYSIKSISDHLGLNYNNISGIVRYEIYPEIKDFEDTVIKKFPKTKANMGRRSLTDRQIENIRKMISEGASYSEIMKKYKKVNLGRHTISRINQGKYKTLKEIDLENELAKKGLDEARYGGNE